MCIRITISSRVWRDYERLRQNLNNHMKRKHLEAWSVCVRVWWSLDCVDFSGRCFLILTWSYLKPHTQMSVTSITVELIQLAHMFQHVNKLLWLAARQKGYLLVWVWRTTFCQSSVISLVTFWFFATYIFQIKIDFAMIECKNKKNA